MWCLFGWAINAGWGKLFPLVAFEEAAGHQSPWQSGLTAQFSHFNEIPNSEKSQFQYSDNTPPPPPPFTYPPPHSHSGAPASLCLHTHLRNTRNIISCSKQREQKLLSGSRQYDHINRRLKGFLSACRDIWTEHICRRNRSSLSWMWFMLLLQIKVRVCVSYIGFNLKRNLTWFNEPVMYVAVVLICNEIQTGLMSCSLTLTPPALAHWSMCCWYLRSILIFSNYVKT